MSHIRIHIIALAIATALPTLIFAQDPTAPPASIMQPSQPPRSPSASTAMQDSSSASDTAALMKDRIFLRKALEAGMAQIQFGQLATQKATSDDLKQFADKMVAEHTELNHSFAPIADSLGLPIPHHLNKDDQTQLDKLAMLSGNDFDTEYLTLMVRSHHKDLREFRQELQTVADPTLRDAIETGEHTLHDHTVLIDKLARQKGIAMPGRHSMPPPPQ